MFNVGDAVYITAKVERFEEEEMGWSGQMYKYLNDGVVYHISNVLPGYVRICFPNGEYWAFLPQCLSRFNGEAPKKAPKPKRVLKQKHKNSLAAELDSKRQNRGHSGIHNWATESAKGERIVKVGDACYSRVRYGREHPLAEIIFQYQKPRNTALKTWVKRVFMFKGVQDSTLSKSYASLLKWGYKGNVDKASLSAITASAIMLREGFEFPSRAELFHKLINSHVIPEVAYLLASGIRLTDNGSCKYYVAYGGGHSALSDGHSVLSLLKFLKNGFVFDTNLVAKEHSTTYKIFVSIAPVNDREYGQLDKEIIKLLPPVATPTVYGAKKQYTYEQVLVCADKLTALYNEVV